MDFRRKHIDLVGKMKLWFGISLALILVGLASWALFGLNLGIDFKGGGQFQYRIPYSMRPQAGQEAALQDRARSALETQGLKTQPRIAGGDTLVIQTLAKDQSELTGQEKRVRRALTTFFAGGQTQNGQAATLTPLGQQFVGPVIGDELKRNAITGVLLGVALIALWIYIRYNFAGDGTRYAVAGVVALVHDVLVLVGLFALIGHLKPSVEIDGAFIAALLTVVGYSINDSVVIFDRLRENLRLRRKEPFEKVVNDSLLETMSRSINTGLTVLIMLFVLLMLGGESIYNFVLAMLVGIASGLYSSIFNASMVLVAWHRWDEKKAARLRASGGLNAASSTRLTTPNRASLAPSSASASAATTSAAKTSVAPPRRGSFATTVLPSPDATNAATHPLQSPSVSGQTASSSSLSTATIATVSSETVSVPVDAVLSSSENVVSPTDDFRDSTSNPQARDEDFAAEDFSPGEETATEKERAPQRVHPKARARRRF